MLSLLPIWFRWKQEQWKCNKRKQSSDSLWLSQSHQAKEEQNHHRDSGSVYQSTATLADLTWMFEIRVLRESEHGSAPLSHVEQQILDSPASCPKCVFWGNQQEDKTLCPYPQYNIKICILLGLSTSGLSVTSSSAWPALCLLVVSFLPAYCAELLNMAPCTHTNDTGTALTSPSYRLAVTCQWASNMQQ